MPREILIQILKEKLIFSFIIILIAYFAVNLINLKLIYQTLGINISFKKILPGVILLILYNIFGKQILSNGLPYGLILIIILVTTVKIIGGKAVSWIRSFWASFLTFFIVLLGVLSIQISLSLKPEIARFITKTPLGVVCGSVMELTFPLIFLFLLKTIDISIIPPVKRKINLLDCANLTLFAGLFLLLYNAFARTLKYLDTYSKIDLIKNMLYEWLIVGLEIGVYRFIYTINRKNREEERRKYEETINELKTQNKELIKLNEHLKNIKVKPVKLISDIENVINNGMDVISQIKNYYNTLEESEYILIKPDKLLEYNLKHNEKLILEGIMADKTYQEIGDEIFLVEGSVKNIAARIYKKFGVKNRKEMEEFVIKNLLKDKDDTGGN